MKNMKRYLLQPSDNWTAKGHLFFSITHSWNRIEFKTTGQRQKPFLVPWGLNGLKPKWDHRCLHWGAVLWGVQMMLSLLEVLHQLPAPQGTITQAMASLLGHDSVGVLCAQHVKDPLPLHCVLQQLLSVALMNGSQCCSQSTVVQHIGTNDEKNNL